MKPPQQALFKKMTHVMSLVLILLLSSCTRQNSKRIDRHYQEAARAIEVCDFKKALNHAHNIASLEPSPRALALKATLLYQNGRLQESKKTFELALQQKNISPLIKTTILNNYAAVLVRLGEHKKAGRIWQKLVTNKFYTTPEVAWVNLGLLAWEKSKLQKKNIKRAHQDELNALHYFAKAITLEPEYVDAHFFRAQIFDKQKRKIEALRSLNKVVQLEPRHTEAKKMLKKLSC